MVKYIFEFCYFEQEEVETAIVIKRFDVNWPQVYIW